MTTLLLLDHMFRRQSGRLVACLAGLLGSRHLQLAEDAVQEALLRAAQVWPLEGVPASPEGWLFRVAHNHALTALRRSACSDRKTTELVAAIEARIRVAADREDLDTEQQFRDDELRMIFMCCHPELPTESRIALSLKLAAGFSVGEIARVFLVEEEAVAQRLVRAKRLIRERGLPLEMPSRSKAPERLDSVLEVIYLMFSGGYAVADGEDLIRQEVCLEALRLGQLVAQSSTVTRGTSPAADALVALMALQAARLPARISPGGDLVLLEEQDRSLWDSALITLGFHYFDRSISGDQIFPWHVQAAIAATHARADDRGSIDWPAILVLYDHLLELTGSPVVALNRAVAVGKVHGPEAALGLLAPLEADKALRRYHLLSAVRGSLLAEMGRLAQAEAAFYAALACPCAGHERRFLRAQIEKLHAH